MHILYQMSTLLKKQTKRLDLDKVRQKIRQRRRQILVHSYIYYELNDSLIGDNQWTQWALELVELQRKFPFIAESVEFHDAFLDFDGSTGYSLPYRDSRIAGTAEWLLRYNKEKNDK